MAKQKREKDHLPFGKILKTIMTERGLTVRAIGEMAGVSPSVVQSWVTQSSPQDLQAVARLAKALNMSFKGLLLGQPEVAQGEINPAEIFEEQDLFEGICKVKIQRLMPRKGN